jgi:hypothetical protein
MHTIALNAKIGAATQFTNHNFNSYCNFNGMCLGFNSSGLHRVMYGGADNTTQIDTIIEPVTTDLGIGNPKGLRFLYIGFRSDNDVNIDVSWDDGTPLNYTIISNKDGLQRARVTISRAIYGRYLTVTIKNTKGGYLSVDSVRVLPVIKSEGFI